MENVPETFPNAGKLILEMVDRVMKHMASQGAGKNFTYVESGLIKAARLGYGFEIQEIGTVLRPGVAVGLNALLETGGNAYITLPTGEVIKNIRKQPLSSHLMMNMKGHATLTNQSLIVCHWFTGLITHLSRQ